jgi:hypothetical protein
LSTGFSKISELFSKLFFIKVDFSELLWYYLEEGGERNEQ